MNPDTPVFGLDPLPIGVEPWSVAAVLGTWFGAGLAAPFRSLLATVSIFVLLLAMPRDRHWGVVPGLWCAAIVSGALVGRAWSEAAGIPDDRRIAVDEVAGVLLACLPALGHRGRIALAAALFVAVDTLKPWPVSLLHAELPWNLGILLDDLAAGLLVAGLVVSDLAVRAARGGSVSATGRARAQRPAGEAR